MGGIGTNARGGDASMARQLAEMTNLTFRGGGADDDEYDMSRGETMTENGAISARKGRRPSKKEIVES